MGREETKWQQTQQTHRVGQIKTEFSRCFQCDGKTFNLLTRGVITYTFSLWLLCTEQTVEGQERNQVDLLSQGMQVWSQQPPAKVRDGGEGKRGLDLHVQERYRRQERK
jgi:hypothetical protein